MADLPYPYVQISTQEAGNTSYSVSFQWGGDPMYGGRVAGMTEAEFTEAVCELLRSKGTQANPVGATATRFEVTATDITTEP